MQHIHRHNLEMMGLVSHHRYVSSSPCANKLRKIKTEQRKKGLYSNVWLCDFGFNIMHRFAHLFRVILKTSLYGFAQFCHWCCSTFSCCQKFLPKSHKPNVIFCCFIILFIYLFFRFPGKRGQMCIGASMCISVHLPIYSYNYIFLSLYYILANRAHRIEYSTGIIFNKKYVYATHARIYFKIFFRFPFFSQT